MKNKFGSLFEDITRSEEIPLSDVDIMKITNNKTKIVLYEQLSGMTSSDFLDLFRPETNYNIILLYQLQSFGHWITIIDDRNDTGKFFHWDPYALYPDHELNTMYPYRDLSRLYETIGRYVDVNKYRFQAVAENVNSCGRWSALRATYYYMTNDEFTNYFTKIKPSSLVTTNSRRNVECSKFFRTISRKHSQSWMFRRFTQKWAAKLVTKVHFHWMGKLNHSKCSTR